MKSEKSKRSIIENVIYTILGIALVACIVTNRIINGFSDILWLVDLCSILSFAYIIFMAEHSWYGFLFNLLSTLVLIVVDIIQHIWLNTAICVCVSIPFLIYGMIRWKKNQKSGKEEKNLNKLSWKMRIAICVAYAVMTVPFVFLIKALGGNMYVLDALYSVGCVIGLVLCAGAYIEQFLVFAIANSFGIVMYILLSVQNINNLSMIIILAISTIGNIIGLINWITFSKEKKFEKTEEE